MIGGARRPAPLHGLGRPILTDSGGFQVFSLGALRKITEEGVRFASPINGDRLLLTPEESMRIQRVLDSDIAMMFDECTPYPATERAAADSMRLSCAGRSARSASGSAAAATANALFGIVQGGMYEALRDESLAGPRGDRLRRLRDRRAVGRRAEGGHAAHPRATPRRACRPTGRAT